MKHKVQHHILVPINGCNGYDSGSDGSCSGSPRLSQRRHSSTSLQQSGADGGDAGTGVGVGIVRRLRIKSRTGAFRRCHYSSSAFVLFLLIYTFGFITSFGILSGMFKPSPEPPQPGTVYRSPEIFYKLWPHIRSDNSAGLQISSLWSHRRSVKEEKMCANTTMGKPLGFAVPDGYLIVEANGGLNQQRSAICNAVSVAKLLNATLVIPHLEFHSVWKDPSVFGDIYDENYFIDTLKDYVTVVKELPSDLMERYNNNVLNIRNVKVKAGASANYYLKQVRPLLLKEGVIRIAPFANRLANSVPPDIQFVRCLANFQALRFSAPISRLAEEIVNRMSQNSSRTNGKYVAVHLRFEEDMVAFSCCVYDGGWIEDMEMDYARDKGWRNKFTQKDHVIDPGSNRLNGKCPLTPLEVGMMLRGMGFGNNTAMYIASGKIYRAKKNLAPLLQMFPLAQTKESLATKEELLLLKGYSSRLAALDYAVALQSEAFVATQGGNFAHFLRGHRQFLYGHAKTIKPDKKKLVLLLHNSSLSWEDFKEEMELMLAESDREGKMEPKIKKDKKRHPSIFEHPTRECICLRHHMN